MESFVIRGRGVVDGWVQGEALVCPQSITGWGGIDPATGIIQEYGNPNRGRSIQNKILVLPGSKGSNGWSCYFGATRVSGTAPVGWIFTRIDASAGVASAVLRIPTVVDIEGGQDPCKLIASGDRVQLNGTTGEIVIYKRGPLAQSGTGI